MWYNLIFQNQKIKFVLRDLLDLVKFIVFLWKFLLLEIYIPTPCLPCFMVIEPVDTKPWPVNSDQPWRLDGSISSTISTDDAQRRRVFGTSVAGTKAAAIGRIFDIPEGQYEVSSPGRPCRANPEGVKNVPLSISILPVSSDDIPTQTLTSWCCGTFPPIANFRWSRSMANMTAWRKFDEVLLYTQAAPHLDNHPL